MIPYIKILIIGDTPDLREYAHTVQLLGSFNTAQAGLTALKELKPDLVFINVHMSDMDAFSLLDLCGESRFEVVFIADDDRHALKAIKHNALDYIIKPMTQESFEASLSRYHRRCEYKRSESELENTKMVLPVREGFLFIDILKIVRCEGDGNYTRIYMNDLKVHVASKTLKDFEQLLPSDTFVRIHKSHLINVNFVKIYKRGEGSAVVMSDDSELEVSRRNRDNFLKHIIGNFSSV